MVEVEVDEVGEVGALGEPFVGGDGDELWGREEGEREQKRGRSRRETPFSSVGIHSSSNEKSSSAAIMVMVRRRSMAFGDRMVPARRAKTTAWLSM